MEIITTQYFDKLPLNVYGTIEKPMFRVKEIGKMLELSNIRANLQSVPDKYKFTVNFIDSVGRPHLTTYITEPALYMLTFKSHKEKALDFTDWVVSKVLPSIRKTGKYEIEYKTPKPMLCYSINNESDLQKKTVNFVRQYQNPHELLFSSTCGENQDTEEKRINSWQMGYQAGFPDFIMYNNTRKYNGCVIEFKTPKCYGLMSKKQDEIIKHFKKLDYKCIVSNNYDDIVIKLIKYINLIRIKCNYCKGMFKTKKTLKNHFKYFHRINTN